jgi:hypothetical protein
MSKRIYSQYDREYQATPMQKKRRAQRNAARRRLMEQGRVHKGDGKDVDHISGSKTGGLNNSPGNLRVQPRSKNRARKV